MTTTPIDPSIFKAYDVRGIYPDQIDGEVARRDRAARSSTTWARSASRSGRDVRLSSPEIAAGFIRGRAQPGLRGRRTSAWSGPTCCTTASPATTSTAARSSPPPTTRRSGTASRWCARARSPSPATPASRRSRRRSSPAASPTTPATSGPPAARADDRATTTPSTACPSSTRRAVPPLKVVLDTGNGMGAVGAARHLPAPAPRAGARCTSSSTAPSRTTRRTRSRRRTAARSWRGCRRRRRDLGIAWDGDADRCFFIDDTGAVRARRLRHRAAGRGVLPQGAGRARSSTTCARRARSRDRVEAAGGTALMHRVGPRLHQEADARRERGLRRRGVGPLLLPRQLVRRQRHDPGPAGAGDAGHDGQAASASCWPPCASATTSRARSTRRSRTWRRRWRASRSATRTRAITKLDGVSVDYDDWHFNVRPLEHRAAAPPEPRGVHAGRNGAAPRRGARGHPGLTCRAHA